MTDPAEVIDPLSKVVPLESSDLDPLCPMTKPIEASCDPPPESDWDPPPKFDWDPHPTATAVSPEGKLRVESAVTLGTLPTSSPAKL